MHQLSVYSTMLLNYLERNDSNCLVVPFDSFEDNEMLSVSVLSKEFVENDEAILIYKNMNKTAFCFQLSKFQRSWKLKVFWIAELRTVVSQKAEKIGFHTNSCKQLFHIIFLDTLQYFKAPHNLSGWMICVSLILRKHWIDRKTQSNIIESKHDINSNLFNHLHTRYQKIKSKGFSDKFTLAVQLQIICTLNTKYNDTSF